jgi:hypothetical protein
VKAWLWRLHSPPPESQVPRRLAMSASKILLLLLLFQAGRTFAWAGIGGVQAVGFLAQRADLVVVARIQEVIDRQFADGTSSESIDLLVIRTLKGQVAEPSLVAKVVPGMRSAIGILSRSFVGATGVWFLKDNAGVHEALPLTPGAFDGRDLFVPVRVVDPVPTGSLGQQVLAYQLRWYESLPYPTPSEDDLVFQSLIHDRGQDAGDAIAALSSSAVPNHRVPGIAAAIRLGSSDALLQVARELETLRSRINFNLVLSNIRGYLGPQSPATVKAMEKLAALHSDLPGLDDAICTALAGGIGQGGISSATPNRIRAILPGLLLLLDSKDATAQIRAARFFAYFAQFADASEGIPGTGVIGPFACSDARRFDPAEGSTTNSTQYAQFWKAWCAQNRAKLRF